MLYDPALASDATLAVADSIAGALRHNIPVTTDMLVNWQTRIREAWRTLAPMEQWAAERIAETRVVRLRPALALVEGGRP